MTDFTNLAALVAQGQSLLDLVKGGHITQLEADSAAKLGEVDAALAAKIAQANTAIANATAPINDKIPRIQLTKNQELYITDGTVPDDMRASMGTSFEFIERVAGEQSQRTAGAMSKLAEIETDLVQQFADFNISENTEHLASWNIIRISWDFNAAAPLGWIAFNDSVGLSESVPMMSGLMSAALVKLESGGAEKYWAEGCELGKWRFCSSPLEGARFGGYRHVHPIATTPTGSMLVALPVTVSGVIAHPRDLFKNIEII
jgi:hypothetical protein